MSKGILVTVFSDASYNDKTRCGGWGGWAKSSRGRVYEGGPLVYPVHDSSDAEFRALARAIIMAYRKGVAQSGDTILIQSDNKGVLEWVRNWFHHGKFKRTANGKNAQLKIDMGHKVMDVLDQVRPMIGKLVTKHVKGHQGYKKPRYAVNEICDDLANQGRMKAEIQRENLKSKKGKKNVSA